MLLGSTARGPMGMPAERAVRAVSSSKKYPDTRIALTMYFGYVPAVGLGCRFDDPLCAGRPGVCHLAENINIVFKKKNYFPKLIFAEIMKRGTVGERHLPYVFADDG